jgi:hypothetical protein
MACGVSVMAMHLCNLVDEFYPRYDDSEPFFGINGILRGLMSQPTVSYGSAAGLGKRLKGRNNS